MNSATPSLPPVNTTITQMPVFLVSQRSNGDMVMERRWLNEHCLTKSTHLHKEHHDHPNAPSLPALVSLKEAMETWEGAAGIGGGEPSLTSTFLYEALLARGSRDLRMSLTEIRCVSAGSEVNEMTSLNSAGRK